MHVKKFVAWYLPEILSAIITIVIASALWFSNILKPFYPIDPPVWMIVITVLATLLISGVAYVVILFIVESIFNTFVATHKIHTITRKVISKDTEDTTYYYNTCSILFPLTDTNYYIYVNIDGSEEELWVEEETYKRIKKGDVVEIEVDDMYRFGIYVSTSYYFVQKVAKKK